MANRRVEIDTREQPGGRTGHNVTVNAHLGCFGPRFTMPYVPEDEDPHRLAVEQMVTRLRSSRWQAFGKDTKVTITKVADGRWTAEEDFPGAAEAYRQAVERGGPA